MPDESSPLRRKHTEPYFWYSACAYIVFAAGFVLWLVELIGSKQPGNSGVGVVGMLMGLLGLLDIQNRRLKQRIDELQRQIQGSSADREPNG